MEEFIMAQTFNFSLDEKSIKVSLIKCSPELEILANELTVNVSSVAQVNSNCFALIIDGNKKTAWWARDDDAIYIRFDGRTHTLSYRDAISASQQAGVSDNVIKADMPGIVVKINYNAGDSVKLGDVLIVIESMKMQISIVAPRDGVIKEVNIAANTAFEKNAELISLEEKE
jgi:acetyl/propionyl-CoA carboxylase alpha subunit